MRLNLRNRYIVAFIAQIYLFLPYMRLNLRNRYIVAFIAQIYLFSPYMRLNLRHIPLCADCIYLRAPQAVAARAS